MRGFWTDLLAVDGTKLHVVACNDLTARRVSLTADKWRDVLFFTSAGAGQLADLVESAGTGARLFGSVADEHDQSLNVNTVQSPAWLVQVGRGDEGKVFLAPADFQALARVLRAAAAVIAEGDARYATSPGGAA